MPVTAVLIMHGLVRHVLTFCASAVIVQAAIPDYIKVCRRSDKEFDNCIVNSIQQLKPKLLNGIPELNVPSLEPLIIPEIKLSSGSRAAKLEVLTRNISVSGPSKFIIKSLKSNLQENSFDVELMLPRLDVVGNYDIDVNLLLLPIRGTGVLNGTFSNYRCTVRMRAHIVNRDGEEYLEFEKIGIRLLVGHSQLYLNGLFNGDTILRETTNKILNDNSRIFVEEIKPFLEEALSAVFTDISNRITLSFTYRELFPE